MIMLGSVYSLGAGISCGGALSDYGTHKTCCARRAPAQLKNINIEIPRNSLTVITGLSGSGKSSLAFDTIYAEGQRRYVESLSAYARQFLDQMERPDVDVIEGLSPSIAIEQKTTTRSPRSTVGTSPRFTTISASFTAPWACPTARIAASPSRGNPASRLFRQFCRGSSANPTIAS